MKITSENRRCERCGLIKAGHERWYNTVWNLCWGHNQKVSELTEITDLDDSDYLLISDMSKDMSCKVSLGTLRKYFRKTTPNKKV